MKKSYIFTPGPTPVPPEVALAQVSMVHHRTDEFGESLARVLDGLKYIYQTANQVMLLTSSGTGAMEAAITNCFSPGDKVVVFSGGKFGARLVELSNYFGLDTIAIEHEWGDCADPADLEKAVEQQPDVKGVFLTHSETSTGVVNDVEAFGRVVAKTDALFLVDAISGLGAVDLKTDAWGVDLCVGGSQKGLMTPPGLAFVSVSDRAWKAIDAATLPRYYFCFKAARAAQSKNPPQTPYTPAITLVQAMDVAIQMIRDDGLENVFERHALFGRATRAAVEALGLSFVASDRTRADVCTSVWAPEGMKSGDLVKYMRNNLGVSIAGGQGKLKGKIFRLGHVGYFDAFDIVSQVAALELGLKALGHPVDVGAGVAAAQKVLAEG
jgi:aspartate aminotransferase-like enzyme